MPTVSVIMGVYNCNNKMLLEKSVESVIDQTYKDWELIICDDGSSDDTLQYLRQLENTDRRIKVITYKQNKGLCYALNQCIKCATGKYIARQDDDDISYSTRFAREVEFLEQHAEISFVGTIADVCDDNGIWGQYIVEEKPTKDSFLWNSPFLHPSIVIRKQDLLDVGGYRVERITRRCEDYDLFMRLYAHGKNGYNIQEKLYGYRIVDGKRKKRPMKYRIDEMQIRYRGFCQLGLMPRGMIYVIKPFIIGFFPQKILKLLNKKKFAKT